MRGFARQHGVSAVIRDLDAFRVGNLRASHADIRRARRLLGFVPETALEAGLEEFLGRAEANASLDLSARAAAELAEHHALGGLPVTTEA